MTTTHGAAEITTVSAASAAEVAARRDELVAALDGAVLVRGLPVAEVPAAVAALVGPPVLEREGFAPRTPRPGGYTASAWPPDEPMCAHHELSHTPAPPGLIAFGCLSAPTTGGAIGLADARLVLERLPADVVARFADGWRLIRSYNGEVGVTVEQAFGDAAAVPDYCAAAGIDFEWVGGALRTSQVRPAVVDHPLSGEPCWFNQIAFLNEWTMAPEVREYLVACYGREGLPFTTAFADGEPVPEEVVRVINTVYDELAVPVVPAAGDLLLVDNVRTAHSRAPYTGPREVVVALGSPLGR